MKNTVSIHLDEGEKVCFSSARVSKTGLGNDYFALGFDVGETSISIFFRTHKELESFCVKHNIEVEVDI